MYLPIITVIYIYILYIYTVVRFLLQLWDDKHARDQVVPALRESLSRLGLDYVDLYLIHSPESEKVPTLLFESMS